MDRVKVKSKGSQLKRPMLLAGMVIALIGGGVTLASIDFSTRRVERDQVSVDTVRRGTMEVKVSANGQLLSRHIEQLASQISGRVASKPVKAGTVVEVGQLLLELANPQLLNRMEEAQSAWEGAVAEQQAREAELETEVLTQEAVVTQAQTNLEKAQLQLNAESRLIDKHIVSELQFTRTSLEVDQLRKVHAIEVSRLNKLRGNIQAQLAVRRSRVAQMARELDRARNDAANLKIVAGIRGIVQAIDVEVGQQLQPGSPIGRVAQQDELYAELRVPAREATEVQLGQSVVIDTRRGTVNGTVTRVDPGVTDGTVIVDVGLQGPLPAGARPQLEVEGLVYISQFPQALFVGKPAYVKADAAVSVYKLEPSGRYADRVTVKIGKVSVNHVQVLAGLDAGDRIITSEIGEWQDQERILLN